MSQLDPSIPLGVRPVQIESPLNALAQFSQIQGAQQQNALLRMKMEQEQRAIAEQEAFRTQVAAPGADVGKVLLGQGRVKEYGEWQKAESDRAKQKIELVDAKLKQSRGRLDDVRTPEEYVAWHQANHADPILGPELAARGVTPEKSMASIQQALQTPGGFQELLQKSALGLEKFTEQNKPTYRTESTGQVDRTVAYPGLGGAPQVVSQVQKVATPGEVLTDARGRQQLAVSQGQLSVAQENLGLRKQELAAGKVPSGYRMKADGTQEFIPGGPADPNAARRAAPTEDERKAAGWLAQATKGFGDMEKAITDEPAASKPGVMESIPFVPEAARNVSRSDARQRFNQGASAFAEATLRAATGAGVNESEARQKIAEVTPQWGDKPAVIKQKRESMKMYLQSLTLRSGRAAPQAVGAAPPDAGADNADPLGLRGGR